jgi:acetamidase/formamidase
VRSKELETGTPGLVHHSRSAGLLPDDFPDPYIRVFDLTNGEFAYLREDIAIPIEPFFGRWASVRSERRSRRSSARQVRREHGRAFEKAGFRVVGKFVDPEDGETHALVCRDR